MHTVDQNLSVGFDCYFLIFYLCFAVANSTKKIKVAEFKKFCQEAYVFKIKAFKWPSCPTTLHRGYSHLADIIELNDGIGLGDISESCLGWEKPSVLNLKIGSEFVKIWLDKKIR